MLCTKTSTLSFDDGKQILLQFCYIQQNKGKGGKTRKRGKNNSAPNKRDLVLKEEGQEYGQVLRMLGNGRLEAGCVDGKKRLCHIRGKMRKKVWVNTGDTVLISLREYQDDKGDVIHKFSAEEARELKKMGAIDFVINESSVDVEEGDEDESGDDIVVDFAEV